MEITEETVKEFMDNLSDSDPILAYIIGEMGLSLKNHENRIQTIESKAPTPSN